MAPDFLCIVGYYGGKHLHHVFRPMSAKTKLGASSNDAFTVHKFIVQGFFRWLDVTE